MKFLFAFLLSLTMVTMVDIVSPKTTGAEAIAAKKKKSKKGRRKKGSGRQRIVVKDAKVKFNKRDKTNVDFDEATLEGRRRNPSGIALNQQKANKDFDLIKLREHWKPEMIQSTQRLTTQ